jgi:hypothetical protein
MEAKTNDQLRKRIPLIEPPDLLVITSGVASLGEGSVARILQKVRNFNNFNKDNDPYKEHDFGLFTHRGETIYWKIDDYAGQDGYNLVLTVLLAEEY